LSRVGQIFSKKLLIVDYLVMLDQLGKLGFRA